MDIDETKELWRQISDRVEKQEKLTNEVILRMAQTRSKNRLSKVFMLEIGGNTWLFAFICYILFKLETLDTTPLLFSGILSMIISLIAIVMSANFIIKASTIDIVRKSYKQTILDFAACQKAYHINKKFYLPLGFALLASVCPVVFKLTNNTDVFTAVPLATILLYIGAGGFFYTILTLVHVKYYNKQINQIDELLREVIK
ncbi:hypothetical protein KK062_04135 [Fulvivirgaceae bacterium PWU5]|uniref:Uncharacterized protein n=1 Tax=Dawidia cretensis TaxID=2782350 RepID=A0AAP2DTY2_9BACT|nr:hypothetical protein [Dawidia cretensis]MBT1707395.1 hypothetical protein [Dawidia cretensis]